MNIEHVQVRPGLVVSKLEVGKAQVTMKAVTKTVAHEGA